MNEFLFIIRYHFLLLIIFNRRTYWSNHLGFFFWFFLTDSFQNNSKSNDQSTLNTNIWSNDEMSDSIQNVSESNDHSTLNTNIWSNDEISDSFQSDSENNDQSTLNTHIWSNNEIADSFSSCSESNGDDILFGSKRHDCFPRDVENNEDNIKRIKCFCTLIDCWLISLFLRLCVLFLKPNVFSVKILASRLQSLTHRR